MLDEKKTKKQLIDDIKSLREHLATFQHRQLDDQKSDISIEKTLAWKDFLLGLHEKSCDFNDEDLYRYILDEVVRLTQSDIGFLHLVSEDQQSVILTCWHEKALQHCTASHETHYPVDQAGNWADCLYLKRPVVYNDFSQAPNRKGLPPGHNPILRFMGIPLIEQGKVRIILGVGNKSEDYDDEEVFQTQLVANNLQSILTRRRVEKQLRENEERLFLSLQATQDAIWDWNIVQGTGYASLNYFTMLGYKPDEFLMNSEYWWQLIHCDDVQKVRAAMDRVMNNPDSGQNTIPSVEFRMRKKTGEWRWILARGKVVTWDRDGRPLRMMGTHTDITDRKRAEEALRESEERYRSLFETANDAILLMDRDFIYVDCNSKAMEITRRSRNEIIGHNAYEDSPPIQPGGNDSETAALLYVKEAVSGRSQKFYWQSLRKDGTLLDLDVCLNKVTLGEQDFLQVIARDITEQKQAEKALRESEGKFKDLVEQSIVGVYLIQDGLFQYVNAKFAEIFGYDMAEMTGKMGPKDVVFADDLPLVEKNIDQRISGELKDIHYAFRIVTKTGEIRYIEVYSSRTAYCGRTAVIGTLLDLTERRQMVEALRQNEATLRSVFNASPIGLCAMRGRVFQSANKAWYDLFGYTEAEIIGHTTRMLYENDGEYERVGRELSENLKDRGLASVQTRIKRKDGVLRDVIVTAAALERENLFHGTVVTIEDITDRMRAEDELKESQRRLFDIIEFLPDATLVIDQYGKILAWNLAMETMTGVKKEDMLGKGKYEYALPFYGTRRPILIDLVLHQDEAVENQYVTIRRFGDALFAETRAPNLPPGDVILAATASVLRDSDGEIIAAIECIRDVTHQTRLESKLRQAQKMEAIGTLAGGIAHDFNNILASTIGYTELAIMNIGKPNLLNGYLEQVMKACDRAKNLVNQILVFSRQREQERKPVDMTVIVKEALKLLRASLPSTIKINHHFPSEPATVLADPTQIHQIVMNLCTNAAQAMPENGGEMDVSLSSFSVSTTMAECNPVFKAGAYVQLVVKDTGHGIDPAIIDKIFDPFFTTKRHQEGTGLGLSVVYGIVNSYNGVVQVTSELGQGTIFNVYIPAIEEIKVTSEQKTKEPIHGGTESLLLVDDEELLVQAMEKYLGALGYDVVSSTNSPEALYMVQENPCRFDLMVTDMTMPHMTGLKLSREVLAINPLLPIILCTGYNESITEDEVKRSGIKEFVLKPVSLQKMAYLIRQVLDMQ